MSHFYMRLIIGIIWIAASVSSAISYKFSMSGLYFILGALFLYSAYSIFKKEKKSRGK